MTHYITTPGPDGDSMFVVHRPTGRTISQFAGDGHAERAKRAADALNEAGEADQDLHSNTFSVTL